MMLDMSIGWSCERESVSIRERTHKFQLEDYVTDGEAAAAAARIALRVHGFCEEAYLLMAQ